MQTIEIKKTSDEAKKERTYPYMGINECDIMVWFTKPKTGIAIRHSDKKECTNITDNWLEHLFSPMQGNYTFTFKND